MIVENFYSDPDAVVSYARRLASYYPYQASSDVETGRARASWMTSRFRSAADCPFKSSTPLIDALEALTGDRIDLDHWKRDFPRLADGRADTDSDSSSRSCLWNCSFHVKLANNQELGEGVHNHVTDNWNAVGEEGWAGLVYLNATAQLRGGLRTWRNVDSSRNLDWMTPKENWRLIDDLANVYNRLLLCRGNLPHSGAAGWGSGLEDGRLFQTFFFKVVKPSHRPSLVVIR